MNNQQVIDLLSKLPTRMHVNMMSKINVGLHLYYACECLDCKMPFVYTLTDNTGISQTPGSGKRQPSIPSIQMECQKCKSPKRMSITPITKEHLDTLNSPPKKK